MLSAATVFLPAEPHEGTPNVIVEALASGRQGRGQRRGGIPELVRNGANGLW